MLPAGGQFFNKIAKRGREKTKSAEEIHVFRGILIFLQKTNYYYKILIFFALNPIKQHVWETSEKIFPLQILPIFPSLKLAENLDIGPGNTAKLQI